MAADWRKHRTMICKQGESLRPHRNPLSSGTAVKEVVRDSRIVAIAGDCKSPDFGLRWFESILSHIFNRGLGITG